MLLLEANRLVPAHRLIDELWGEALPADPPAALRTQISRLRRALGPAGGSLVTADGGYRLSLQRRQLDAARFEDALAAAAHRRGNRVWRFSTRRWACGGAPLWPSSRTGRSRGPRLSGSTSSG